MSKCNQVGCNANAAYKVVLAGGTERLICEGHKHKVETLEGVELIPVEAEERESQALCLVGHKSGRVYLQHGGNVTGSVKPNYISWEPDQARELAALLLTAADAAEGKE